MYQVVSKWSTNKTPIQYPGELINKFFGERPQHKLANGQSFFGERPQHKLANGQSFLSERPQHK